MPTVYVVNPKSKPFPGVRSKYDNFLSPTGMNADRTNQLWSYLMCWSFGCGSDPQPESPSPVFAGWPSYGVDQPASEARSMGWVSFEYKMTGEIWWDVLEALPNAWNVCNSLYDNCQFIHGGNGDGTLFYPGTPARIGGTHDIPIESIRMKRIRDGREDFELLTRLAQAGNRAKAMPIARSVYPAIYCTDVTTADCGAMPGRSVDAARQQLIALIDALP